MSDTITALTVCQPWAWAIMEGYKRFENRTWYSRHRGPLVIHAGKSRGWLHGIDELRYHGYSCPDEDDLIFGAILGLVEQTDCVPISADICQGDVFADGPWCHVYLEPRKLAVPVLYRGRQGDFQVPRELVAELLQEQAEP